MYVTLVRKEISVAVANKIIIKKNKKPSNTGGFFDIYQSVSSFPFTRKAFLEISARGESL